MVFQDVLGQSALLQFMQTRLDRVALPTTIHCDHLIQARVEGEADLRASLNEDQEVYAFLRSAAAKYGCGFALRAPASSTRWCSRITPSPAR